MPGQAFSLFTNNLGWCVIGPAVHMDFALDAYFPVDRANFSTARCRNHVEPRRNHAICANGTRLEPHGTTQEPRHKLASCLGETSVYKNMHIVGTTWNHAGTTLFS